MEIFLIRHTRPLVATGICYGQTDLALADSFESEAGIVRDSLPQHIGAVYSSPLQRCRLLAEWLFPEKPLNLSDDLMELNCGQWEMQHWDAIPKHELEPWMADFTEVRVPGGESYRDLFARTVQRYETVKATVLQTGKPAAIVAHGGVIRSILSHISGTSLADSFRVFPLFYGAVASVQLEGNIIRMLSNIPGTPEQHRPST
ncbi:alpha-ribazole phosphatase family protein [Flavihumibacter petaseus]|uniref:Alpha-ribazole phosphatase n=1 Tax=Flavihumibacter petaseus NBRC 106054 TaxID=1220578 RepID=A0A0E9N5V8_9BACT|nr:alpha-ribazole phosphatase family protein [Flavihumibacter petaseus]GAO45188.1 hypothetical protein FPE01S_04_04320 [Flavihumibacter petaseus NBRC 106054]